MAAPTRQQRRRGALVTAVAAVVALLGLLAFILAEEAPRRTGTTDALLAVRLHVPPGDRACQPGQTLVAGTGAIRYFPNSTRRAGPLSVRVLDASGRRLLAGTTPAAVYGPAPVTTRIPTVRRTLRGVRVCVANVGRTTVDVFGAAATSRSAELPDIIQVTGFAELRFDYVTAKPESWASFAPTVAGRFGRVKATFFGGWTLWAAAALLLAVCVASVLYSGRELGR